MKKFHFLLLGLLFTVGLFPCASTFAQEPHCAPVEQTTTPKGETLSFYGGTVRKANFLDDNRTKFDFYVLQVSNGKTGNYACVKFSDEFKSSKEYDRAIGVYLNETSLSKSTLTLRAGEETMNFEALSCSQKPTKALGGVNGFNATFIANISRDQVESLQKSTIEQFQFNLGGKVYEKSFKDATPRTDSIKASISCINLESIYTKEVIPEQELDLDEVEEGNYAEAIQGQWFTDVGEQRAIFEFKDGKYSLKVMGRVASEGKYKVASKKIILMHDGKNDISTITMFLKDMISIKDNDGEYTYTRIKN